MQKKNSTKKSGGSKKSPTRKKVKITRKKELGARSRKKETTILTKLKGMFDDTAARLKTFLPGEVSDNRAKNRRRGSNEWDGAMGGAVRADKSSPNE